MFIESEKLAELKKIDLLSYLLQTDTDRLKQISRNTFCIRDHDSLHISNGLWHWQSVGIGGGSALDILIKVEGFSFKEAVKHLQNLSKDIVWEDIKDHQKPIPKYINLRGIHNDYKGDSFGSNKAFSFLLQAKNPTNVVHVCEASIDVLSYASLMKLYQKIMKRFKDFL